MSRIWTAVAIDMTTGKCNRLEFTASYDYSQAAEDFKVQYAPLRLVAMMPGMQVCETYDLSDAPSRSGISAVDPFSLDGLG